MKISAFLLVALLGLCAALPIKDQLQGKSVDDFVGDFSRGLSKILGTGNHRFGDCVRNG